MKRGSSAGGLMVGYWPGMPGVQVPVLLGTTLFVLKIHSRENYLFNYEYKWIENAWFRWL